MMDNQHKKISGYHDLSQEEIDLMNEVKEHAEQTRHLVHKVEMVLINQARNAVESSNTEPPHSIVTEPLRWVAEGRTDLQKGYMSLVRSIAQPTTF